MLLVLRSDPNENMSLTMKRAVTFKALKNKDRMYVETTLEVFSPKVQAAIPEDLVVTTIYLSIHIYTFWLENRPGSVICPIDVTVHKETGTVFFIDVQANQIVMCNLHCPATLAPIAGERTSGLRDGKKSLFNEPFGVCFCGHLLFVCDSGNSAVSFVDACFSTSFPQEG